MFGCRDTAEEEVIFFPVVVVLVIVNSIGFVAFWTVVVVTQYSGSLRSDAEMVG